MADGINVDGGGIDMFPADTGAAIAGLAEAAATFRQAWLGELGKIAGLDSQIGSSGLSPMGRDFVVNYNNSMQAIVEGLDELGRRTEEQVEFGRSAVTEYVAADQENAQDFNNV